MSLLNRHSYLLLGILLAVGGSVYALLGEYPFATGMTTFLVVSAMLVYWVAARRGALTPVNPEKRIRRARVSGRPLVVHFYSDLSLGSLLKRPFTAGAEKAFRGHAEFIYIDVHHKDADVAAESIEADLGDWLLYDAEGQFVEKTGFLSASKLEQLTGRSAAK